jgi:hypothetical protein
MEEAFDPPKRRRHILRNQREAFIQSGTHATPPHVPFTVERIRAMARQKELVNRRHNHWFSPTQDTEERETEIVAMEVMKMP